MQGLPVVCFADSGGGPEFVGEDAGIVVPYLDLDAFSHALRNLRSSTAARQTMGDVARRKVMSNYGVDTQGPKLLESMQRCLAS